METVTVGGDTLTYRVTSEHSDGALLAFEIRMAPGGGPPVLHRHDAFELYLVDAGEFTFYREDDAGRVAATIAGPGSVIPIPGGREHTIRNESEHEAHALVVLSPGAAMERFTRAAGALAASGEPQLSEVMSLAAEHGIELTRGLEEVA